MPVDLDSGGATNVPCARRRRAARPRCSTRPAAAIAATCASSVLLRLVVDHRSDVGVEPRRIADRKLVHRAGQQLDDARRDLLLQEQHAQRRAALAGAVEGRRRPRRRPPARAARSCRRSSRSGRRSRRSAARWGRRARASARLIARAVSVEPVNATPAMRGSSTSAAPTVSPAPGSSARRRPARRPACQNRRRALRDAAASARRASRSRRCRRRAPRRPGRREDRQREIPRADAREHAAAVQRELVRFAGRRPRATRGRAKCRRASIA